LGFECRFEVKAVFEEDQVVSKGGSLGKFELEQWFAWFLAF